MKEQMKTRRGRHLVNFIYNQSAVDQRYSVMEDFGGNDASSLFKGGEDGYWIEPTTAQRNDVYCDKSKELAVDVVQRLLDKAEDFDVQQITHVVTVSCTGFFNPGIDYHVVRQFHLNPSVQRYHLGFMGCYAAFPAMRMAEQFCAADPEAVVLVLCLELCSLHLQLDEENPEGLVASSLFADGAAAALVSARKPREGSGYFEIMKHASALAPAGEQDMAWEIGDNGFNIVLSSYVPEILGANIHDLVRDLIRNAGLGLDDVSSWAVHPGGKSILDKVGEGLGLDPRHLAVSRDILREYGNMSSATILFVLQRMLDRGSSAQNGPTCAMAFGPGLTVEMSLLDFVAPSRNSQLPEEADSIADSLQLEESREEMLETDCLVRNEA
jgi:predicted naringenin-chalcone synthase